MNKLNFFQVFTIATLIAAFIFPESHANIEVSLGTSGVHVTTRSKDNPSSNSTTGNTLTNVQIAVYVTSCLAVFFITICCFYCCKHFCCDGCRGEASVTYEQMGPTPFNTGSIRVPTTSTTAPPIVAPHVIVRPMATDQNEPEGDMIPLQGMKRVTFASNLTSTSPRYVYENFP